MPSWNTKWQEEYRLFSNVRLGRRFAGPIQSIIFVGKGDTI
jgi:hypothetical protein